MSRRACLLGCNNCAEGPKRRRCAGNFAKVCPEPSGELRRFLQRLVSTDDYHTRIAVTDLDDDDDENVVMLRIQNISDP